MSVTKTALVNVVGGLIFGWVAIGSNTAAGLFWPCMYDQHDTWVKATLQAIVNVGAMLGSLGGGYVTNAVGFKKGLFLGSVIAGAATLWTMFANTYAQQTVARVISGLGIGLISSVAPPYVTQVCEKRFPERSGTLGCLFQVSVTIGIFLSTLASYFLLGAQRDDAEQGSGDQAPGEYTYTAGYCESHSKDWIQDRNMYLFIPGVAFCAVNAVLSLVIAENPQWEEQREAGAKGVAGVAESTPVRTWILGVMGCVALQLTGINAVMFYSGKFFDAAHYEHKVLGSVLVMAWNFISTLFALSLVERFGRRNLMLAALAMIAVSITLLAPIDVFVKDDAVQSTLCFVCLFVYILGFEMGPGCLFWVYLTEIAPEGSQLFPVANALQWFFTLCVTFCFPPLQDAVGGWVFWFFGVPAIISFFFHLRCLPETKAEKRAQAQALMSDRSRPWNVLALSEYDAVPADEA